MRGVLDRYDKQAIFPGQNAPQPLSQRLAHSPLLIRRTAKKKKKEAAQIRLFKKLSKTLAEGG